MGAFGKYFKSIASTYKHAVFPLISAPDAYFILKLVRLGVYWRMALKRGGRLFQSQRKLQNLVIFSFRLIINKYHYNICVCSLI